ncbi:MAG: hypothetical protein EXR67_00185 [Dehalococcoidia bacterium]|nr:hypothetical protein [Dehalococcoidia bacterium]
MAVSVAQWRRISRILTAAAVVSLLVSWLALPASPVLAAGTFNLSPTSGMPGSTVTVTGSGFVAIGTTAVVTFDGTQVATPPISGTGDVSFSFNVPAAVPGGPHTVTVTAGAEAPAQQFQVTSVAALSANSGQQGQLINISGQGFTASQAIQIKFNGALVAATTANAQGTVSAGFVVPPVPAGFYPVIVGSAPPLTFMLNSGLNISPSSGPVGASVGMTGTGFSAGTSITITFDSVTVKTVQTDANGSFNTTFVVPASAGGPHAIAISGSSVGTSQATFTVNPLIVLDKPNAAPGSSVGITGSGFAANETNISITFDNQTVASGITADSQGRWSGTFTVPAGVAGSHSVRASGAQSTGATVPQVTISLSAGLRFDRASGTPGSKVRISGQGFPAAASGISLVIGETTVAGNISSDSSGQWTLDVTIPTAPSGPIAVRAIVPGSTPIDTVFTITPGFTISQSNGQPGTQLTIAGSGFSANQSGITLNLASANAAVSASAQGSWIATLTVPPAPKGGYSVKVGGSATAPEQPFNVIPGVSAGSNRGAPGTSLVVVGGGFSANERGISVIFDRTPVATGLSANAEGSFTATFPIPPVAAGNHFISASGTVSSGAGVQGDNFSIGAGITANPSKAGPGVTLSIQGGGFDANEKNINITYDGTPVVSGITADPIGAFAAAFVLPPSTGGSHSIKASGSVTTAAAAAELAYQVTPTISFNRATNAPGSPITVRGSGYRANETGIILTFDGAPVGQPATADSQGSFTLTFQAPAAPAGTHRLAAAGATAIGDTRGEQTFSVAPAVLLSAPSGSVGMNVDIIGSGFAAASPITVTYDSGAARASATTDATGSFRIAMPIPKSRHGEHPIAAQDAAGNSTQVVFTVESTAPSAPNLLSPSTGKSGGLFGGFRPALRWAASDDPSGATYQLQIAETADFASPVLTKNDLTAASYTLNEQEALPRGKYYWRVKPTDLASNEGQWSSAFVVQSGIIPFWSLPLILALLLAGAAGAYYQYVYKPRKARAEPVYVPVTGQIRDMPNPEASGLALSSGRGQTLATPLPRLALPAPARRGRGGVAPEDMARFQMVMDFVRSIPLLELTADLAWLDEIIISTDGADPHENALSGTASVRYQPAWAQHPTYADLQRLLQGQPFQQRLDEYMTAVDACATEALALIQDAHSHLMTAISPDAPTDHRWKLSVAVAQDSIAWFRGTFLKAPSQRDYLIKSQAAANEAFKIATLAGADEAPFRDLLIEDIAEADAISYRNTHVLVRTTYRANERARLLAAKIVHVEVLREQLQRTIAQLDQR